MENSTREIIFTLSGLNDTDTDKKIYFAFALLFYLFTLWVNLAIFITILLDEILHEPMYIFVCNMCVNGICGASSFYPKILLDLLSDSHIISYKGCVSQLVVICSYSFCEYVNLAVMAYDRYVAICKSLEYHTIMTPQMVGKLVLFTWLISLCETVAGLILTLRLPLCGNKIDKLYCTNWEVVKLSCTDTTVNNFYGYFVLILHGCPSSLIIIISYVHIIKICLRSAAERRKFMETCLPHIITLINFLFAVVFDIMYARYGSKMTQIVRNILSIEYLVVPPLLNPLIYGLKLNQVRRSMLKLINRKISALK